MNTREYLGARLKAEHKAFKRVLEALPADRLDYKPHERSPDARSLVFTLAAEFACCVDIAKSGRYDWQMTPPPPLPEMIALFDRSHRELVERVASLDDAAWERPVQLYFGGQLALEQPLGEFMWGILFDTIHHRGQLSTYLRPMGGKVPSIYGPSADDPGQ